MQTSAAIRCYWKKLSAHRPSYWSAASRIHGFRFVLILLHRTPYGLPFALNSQHFYTYWTTRATTIKQKEFFFWRFGQRRRRRCVCECAKCSVTHYDEGCWPWFHIDTDCCCNGSSFGIGFGWRLFIYSIDKRRWSLRLKKLLTSVTCRIFFIPLKRSRNIRGREILHKKKYSTKILSPQVCLT